MSCKHSAEVLSHVPKKAGLCLMEKRYMLDQFHCSLSYSVVGGCEFNVNELMIYMNEVSLNRNTHKTRLWIDGVMTEW